MAGGAQRISRYLLALFLILGGLPSALAQPDDTAQNLLQVWQKALQRDPIYAASQAAREAEQEAVPQARSRLMPQVSADALALTSDSRRASSLGNGSNSNLALWALTLQQPLFNLEAWRGLERAGFIAQAADVSVSAQYQNLMLRVAEAYFQVLAIQDTLRALLAEKAAVEYQLRAAERGFELGGTTIADTYEAQSRLDLLNAEQIQFENALQVARDSLARIIAEPAGKLATLAEDTALPAPEPNRLDAWTSQASSANLQVLQAQLTSQIVESQLAMAKGRHAPTVDLEAQTGSASDTGLYGPGSGPRSLDSSVGIRLSIPLYSGGEISSVVREQASRLQQSRFEYENARRQAVLDAQRYFAGVTSGLSRIRALEAAEVSSQNAVQANQTGYEIGVRINIDVLDAQRQLYETQRSLAQARYETLMDSLRLKASVGTLSEADIIAVNGLLESP